MPAETHQLGGRIDPDMVLDLVISLVDPGVTDADRATLSGCGVGVDELDWLWDSVCEEFAERTLSPELEAGTLDPGMTIREAAVAMADLLAEGGHDGDR